MNWNLGIEAVALTLNFCQNLKVVTYKTITK
jgi:hypothetical protein